MLLPLVGVWRGEGEASHPSLDESYGSCSSHLRPRRGARSSTTRAGRGGSTAEGGSVVEPAFREVGFWRPQPDDTIELLLVHSSGVSEMFFGQPRGRRRRGSCPRTR
ncbi:FABP family protein [Saccharopolyspora gregorii]|uniref:THAP4-like heme-binding domain-containing protein n=1 Tax=Saccharopolyspora gregorii TaxID=33914 RepID=A0ABP6S364_9PSEU